MNKFCRVFFIDGVRTPFQLSGTGYKNLDPYQLASKSLDSLIGKYDNLKNDFDNVIFGNVIQDSKTSNIARESMLVSNMNKNKPANTVTMACISSNKAITDGFNSIAVNNSSSVIAGGVETMSDLPIKLSKPLRKLLFESRKWKTNMDKLKGISSLKVKDIGIEIPSITEFSTKETMGYSADKLCQTWNVSREDQDEFAVRSHKLASLAQKSFLLKDVIKFDDEIIKDNIIKHNSNLDKLKMLKPVFVKNTGTITAGNSSPLTDGASACLLANENYVKKYNLKPKTEILDYIYYGTDPTNELLLGPAYATSLLLHKNNLKVKDIDVFEIHEAFAGQLLANLNAMNSTEFSKRLNINDKIPVPVPIKITS